MRRTLFSPKLKRLFVIDPASVTVACRTRGERILGPSPPPTSQRAELGAFLRSRRQSVAPRDVGLESSGQRRTPGLRREELAALAGVGLSWYTWLEQGREVKPSAQVLDAIASTLRLTFSERAHLFHLARSESPLPGVTGGDDPGRASLAAFVAALQPHPAYLTAPHLDVLAWNRAADSIIADFSAMGCGRRNLLWWLFTDERFAGGRIEQQSTARRTVARFRAAMGRHPGDPRFTEVLDGLSSASDDFRRIWKDHDVLDDQSGLKEVMRPGHGRLRFHHLQTAPAGQPDLRLTIYAPADATTRSILEASTPTMMGSAPSHHPASTTRRRSPTP